MTTITTPTTLKPRNPYDTLEKEGIYELRIHFAVTNGEVAKVDYSVWVRQKKKSEQTFRNSSLQLALDHYNQLKAIRIK